MTLLSRNVAHIQLLSFSATSYEKIHFLLIHTYYMSNVSLLQQAYRWYYECNPLFLYSHLTLLTRNVSHMVGSLVRGWFVGRLNTSIQQLRLFQMLTNFLRAYQSSQGITTSALASKQNRMPTRCINKYNHVETDASDMITNKCSGVCKCLVQCITENSSCNQHI